MAQTWFITGTSRGLGRALAQAVLEAGDRVVATARRPEQLADLAASHGDRLLALALDVTDPGAVHTAIATALARFGRLDVVVNNAGYANVAPHLRAQGGGTVVQFSSARGRVGGVPGLAAYQAAKFAVDGFSRALAAETAPFGVRVLTVPRATSPRSARCSSATAVPSVIRPERWRSSPRPSSGEPGPATGSWARLIQPLSHRTGRSRK
ncbi:SDR family NAD(P)-dependent oxidoreductase [Amycolatopsis saalfeldensis]|uniref:Short chain dehydrogenase n=1 Tax=Amycolatopsis saalfeldensis TaxID=394193 RepID=A0A1H8VG39_9PSEU|nr:SDR family NAD(P)-dependent oxidoreductase [Amycolatopsis saalfeldensis]SEP14432.1 short chain dehydrogenase [Amycolatopsis saalfeldensis]